MNLRMVEKLQANYQRHNDGGADPRAVAHMEQSIHMRLENISATRKGVEVFNFTESHLSVKLMSYQNIFHEISHFQVQFS
jgi:hypothetical protein